MSEETIESSSETSGIKQEVEVSEAEIIEESSEKGKSWKERLTSPEHWLRFVFMVLFGVISGIAGYVITAVVVLQFVWALITGEGNDKLRKFGGSLSQYIFQILSFLTYNTEDKPFPFSDWPESKTSDD